MSGYSSLAGPGRSVDGLADTGRIEGAHVLSDELQLATLGAETFHLFQVGNGFG